MIEISAADFRVGFMKLANPVEVTKYGKILGTWYPGRHTCDGKAKSWSLEEGEYLAQIRQLEEEVKTLKRRLANQPPETGFGEPRPAPKPRGRPRKVKTEE